MSKVHQQYLQLKKRYPHAILFFQLGDFYETFEEDAHVVSQVCGIVLTSREMGRGNRLPLAGVPVHAADNYIAKLLKAGHRVAICQQLDSAPNKTTRIVEREVTRVVTPGTVVEPALLEDRANNYLVCLALDRDRVGLAYADVTTGEFAVTQLAGGAWEQELRGELERLRPAEVLVPADSGTSGKEGGQPLLSLVQGYNASPWEPWHYQLDTAREALLGHYGIASLEGFGCAGLPAAIRAAGALLQYLQETQRGALSRLAELRTYSTTAFMALDAATRRNLEITSAGRGGGPRGSLLEVLDKTVTPMGGRLLRSWLGQPLLDLRRLEARQAAVAELAAAEVRRQQVVALLRGIGDLERLMARVSGRSATPRDLIALRRSLDVIPQLKALLAGLPAAEGEAEGKVALLASQMDECAELRALVEQAIVPDPPAAVGDGAVIRPGFAAELDDLLSSTREAREWMAGLERVERERTGLKSLKVGYNKVFGYYLEVTNPNLEAPLTDAARAYLAEHAGQVGRETPRNMQAFLEGVLGYVRKQTLVGAERFITSELKEYENLVLNAQERIQEIETRVFREVCAQIEAEAARVARTAQAVAHLDVFAAFAESAVRHNYCRPLLDEGNEISIEAGRHPSVELLLPAGAFVPNDCHLANDGAQLIVLTGPNMAGKSTYLRQVALIVLMAQIGSFVPAKRARIGLVDRIFTRVGAQDDIAAGQSTFLVEMAETATILNHATPRSLVVLDEVGRGTSTFDGMAIARAVVEYLHNHPRLGCKTLFATHYHELTELEKYLPRVRNFRMEVLEEEGQVTFLHRVVAGAADRSYGIYVARLAGVPRAVTRRAEELLRELESNERRPRGREARRPLGTAEGVNQLPLFGEPDPVIEELKGLDVLALSPLEALTKLFELQQRTRERG